MEKPDAETIAWFEETLPADSRAVRSQMFGFPCAFTGGHMFFGTFARSLCVRVGPERVAALAASGRARIFSPMEGRAWKEYAQVDTGTMSVREMSGLALEALEFTSALPAKVPKPKAPRAGKKAV